MAVGACGGEGDERIGALGGPGYVRAPEGPRLDRGLAGADDGPGGEDDFYAVETDAGIDGEGLAEVESGAGGGGFPDYEGVAGGVGGGGGRPPGGA